MSKKYYYLSVKYDDEPDGFGYRYISDDKEIKVGDHVLVTRQNENITGTVIEANFYDYNEVPYPVEYTKKIIKKVDENYKVENNGIKCEPGSFYDSLYNCITNNKEFNVNDFKYPHDSEVNFVDGFEENSFQRNPKEKETKYILDKINNITENNITKTVKDMEEYFNKHKCYTYNYSGEVVKYIYSEKPESNLIYALGISLIIYPRNIELVKLGISILSLLEYPEDEKIFDLFYDLSHVESLGYYLSLLYKNQINNDKLLINACNNVTMWGKINYIEEMNFDNEETLKWILNGGYENEIATFQIAGTIANKTNLVEDFEKYIDDKNITNNILKIVLGLNDGPNYIGDWEQKIDFFNKLIKYKEKLLDNSNFYTLIYEYLYYFDYKDEEETEQDTSCVVEIEKIREDKSIYKHLINIINNGDIDAVKDVCRFLMIYKGEEPHKEIFEFYKKQKSCIGMIFSYLMSHEEYRDETYNIAIKNLDECTISENPQPINNNAIKYYYLEYIAKDIEEYPFYDNKLISKAIKCEDIRTRRAGLETLNKWMKDSKIKYDKLPNDLKETMEFIHEKEMMKDNKKLINKIMGIKESLKSYKEPEIKNVYGEE